MAKIAGALGSAYKRVSVYLASFIDFPAKFIASCCGLGFLPVWGHYWSAFLSTMVVLVICYIKALNAATLLDMSWVILQFTMVGYVIFLPAAQVWLKRDRDIQEEVVLQFLLGQMLVFAISGPGIMYSTVYFISLFKGMCSTFLYCPPWFYMTLICIPVFSLPFATFIIVSVINPWPASYLDKRYKNAFSKFGESISCALYTSLIIYSLAFVFSSLTLVQSIEFFQSFAFYIMGWDHVHGLGIGHIDPFEFIKTV